MVEHVRGMKMTVIIYRTCYRPLDQKYYYKIKV